MVNFIQKHYTDTEIKNILEQMFTMILPIAWQHLTPVS